MRNKITFTIATLVVVLLLASPVGAQESCSVPVVSGQVMLLDTLPADARDGQLESNDGAFLWKEQCCTETLDSTYVSILMSDPEAQATFDGIGYFFDSGNAIAQNQWSGELPAGTYTSHFIHADKDGLNQTFEFSATFDSEIVAIVYRNRPGHVELLETDGPFGAPGTIYAGGGSSRMHELDGLNNWMRVSTDRLTLSARMVVAHNIDDIRVITRGECQQCAEVEVQVHLEGPLTSPDPATRLNIHHLLPGQDKDLSSAFTVRLKASPTPIGQPYNKSPWNYFGDEGDRYGDPSTNNHPDLLAYPSSVVDWVLVSVRADGYQPDNTIWQCAGLLHESGEVEFPLDCECLDASYLANPITPFHLVVEHRNHLPIMSPATQATNNNLAYDFINNDSWTGVANGGVGQKLTGSAYAMFAGNGEQQLAFSRTVIDFDDQDAWQMVQNDINYLRGDYTLNVVANSEDETFWRNNLREFTNVPF